MDIIAALLIGAGVVIGGAMASYGFRKKHIPKGLAFAHGLFVGLGLILLLINALATESHHKHWESIIIFFIAALGGSYLFMQDLKKHYFKLWIMVLHASIGLFGIVWLAIHLIH